MNRTRPRRPQNDIPSDRRRDDRRWKLILARKPDENAPFYYGVRSTGVFCRPECRSRRPRRENVLYFEDVQAARQAGYRPCKRCRPDHASAPSHRDAIIAACRRIERSETPPALAELANEAGLSRFYFQRVFRSVVGVSPRQYATAQRVRRLNGALRNDTNVTAALSRSGFNDIRGAYATARKRLGMSPAIVRKGGAGETLRWTTTASVLGVLSLVASERGLCAVEFVERAADAASRLTALFPNANLVRDDAGLARWAKRVRNLCVKPAKSDDLPLDIRGTAFQQRVWEALRRIPPGKTVTYQQLARQVRAPRAARAVGQACARNTLALVIPCHRAKPVSGDVGGYRWGPERKAALLKLEHDKREG